ncbi:MAG: decarboxylating NADP(+)-dependent phosphogluconate dehydrogenase [Desulfosarcinaceae bacterium]|nr:decarboxylating NADP(+)-dependent phosphogluconate dehydrogenase [Desulfosarcinaceae bacterium]
MTANADIGVVGLAVMGENLILNMAGRGFTVACFNRTTSKVDAFVNGRAAGKTIIGCHSIEALIGTLKKPRKVMCMIRAGAAVDAFIASVQPHLEPGDIIIDGGNSNYLDTIRRVEALEREGLRYVGAGISGGEEGALNGPSIMPGGSSAAWEAVRPIFQKICAYTDDGEPCCDWVGESGAGHFVKMVHNGIEYGDMQLISETYQVMRDGLGLSNERMADVFAQWNQGQLDSYLIEITRDILGYRDETGQATLDQILDTAGQKGTGKWTVSTALDAGQPLTLIGEAVFARFLSALKPQREVAAGLLEGPQAAFEGEADRVIADLEQALYAAKIVSYAQGYQLMAAMAAEQGWTLNYGGIALMWRGGCIIRSAFLGKIKAAFDAEPELANLLLAPFFRQAIARAQPGWRRVASLAVRLGIPIPAISSALAYFDGYRTARLPANLLQAQRDYFGAHTYERVDRPRGEFYHTNWTGRGGDTASSTYEV